MNASLTFHPGDSKQAVKEDLLDVCRALGLRVSSSVALGTVRQVMRAELVELNEAGFLPPPLRDVRRKLWSGPIRIVTDSSLDDPDRIYLGGDLKEGLSPNKARELAAELMAAADAAEA